MGNPGVPAEEPGVIAAALPRIDRNVKRWGPRVAGEMAAHEGQSIALAELNRRGDVAGAGRRLGGHAEDVTVEGSAELQRLRGDQCHSGGRLDATCTGCHAAQQGLYTAAARELTSFDAPPSPMADFVDCESCHDLSEPRFLVTIDETCMDCHEDEEEEYAGMLDRWVAELAVARQSAESAVATVREKQMALPRKKRDAEVITWLNETERVLTLLSTADPVHNPEASKVIYEKITGEASARTAPKQLSGM